MLEIMRSQDCGPEITKIIGDIQDFVRHEDITEYCELLDVLRDGGEVMADWYEVAIGHTLLLTAYLRSRREYGKIVEQRVRVVPMPDLAKTLGGNDDG